ncbi:MAG: hypothetical protein AAGC64_00860 [Bacteroidota bacterium]
MHIKTRSIPLSNDGALLWPHHLLIFFSKALLFLLISFLAWNYVGLLFIVSLVYFIYTLNKEASNKELTKYLKTSVLFLVTWHIGALTWMMEIEMGFFGLICNLVLYFIPLLAFYLLRSQSIVSIYSFSAIFLLFEYWINTISFSYPWLTIGNLLSNQILLAQWYQYTGVLGGSLWILIVATLFVNLYRRNINFFVPSITFCAPIIFSLVILSINDLEKGGKTYKVATFSFQNIPPKADEKQIAYKIYRQFKNEQNLDAIIVPELTFRGLNKETITKDFVFKQFKRLSDKGVSKLLFFGSSLNDNLANITNSSITIGLSDDNKPLIRNKKKLVPWNEYLPSAFRAPFKRTFFDPTIPDDTEMFKSKNLPMPFICYEVFYSFFVGKNLNPSKPIFLLSAEEFMNGSFYGKKQYNNFLRLRSIENRTSIIKASDFGKSLHIDPTGKIKNMSKENNLFEFYHKKNATFYNLLLKHIGSFVFLLCFGVMLLVDILLVLLKFVSAKQNTSFYYQIEGPNHEN